MKPPWSNGNLLDFGAEGCGFKSHCRYLFFPLKSLFLCKIRSNPVQKITNCAFLLSFAK